jgi:hypothetical protein
MQRQQADLMARESDVGGREDGLTLRKKSLDAASGTFVTGSWL